MWKIVNARMEKKRRKKIDDNPEKRGQQTETTTEWKWWLLLLELSAWILILSKLAACIFVRLSLFFSSFFSFLFFQFYYSFFSFDLWIILRASVHLEFLGRKIKKKKKQRGSVNDDKHKDCMLNWCGQTLFLNPMHICWYLSLLINIDNHTMDVWLVNDVWH